eukprot:CAMPEP_0113708872 /NCGR_PEP_ID=MMETSP0038_2-20120614/29242_1 /TAXON_ID=2898 /ORGANISM="Cryptomonas paramecium" /LENGTH=144 /DNA_ID=CAMNT_0000634665 /DNA_START=30 /DNA_END=464 /DNA_ORIENTATION=+ /assembly_acc=CAM_ASM_000170
MKGLADEETKAQLHPSPKFGPMETVQMLQIDHREVDLESRTDAWRNGVAHKAVHSRVHRANDANDESAVKDTFAREILPAWRAARVFVGGPDVAAPEGTALCEARVDDVFATHFMRRGWPGSKRPGLPNLMVDTHANMDHIGQD